MNSNSTTGGTAPRSSGSIGSRAIALFEFERIIAVVLVFIPVGLWIGVRSDYSFLEVIGIDKVPADDKNFKASISAHHDISDARWFYAPMVIGAMMFLVSGLVRPARHAYNAALGIALFGVIWFDHDGSSDPIHKVSTAIFLGLAVLVATAQLTDYFKRWFNLDSRLARQIVLVVSTAIIAIIGLWLNSALNTTAAEWFLLVVAAVHFFTHSWMHDRYERLGKHVAEPIEILDELVPGFRAIRQPINDLWLRLTT